MKAISFLTNNKFKTLKMRKLIIFLGILFVLYSCEKEPIIFEDKGTLPIVKLTIDEKYLWSPDSGLYVIGINGIGNECSFPANFNQKWEFPAHIEYEENSEVQFSHNVGFRIKGNCSRGNAMKSLGIYWRTKYGNENLQYNMFQNSLTTTYNRLFLRSSGNDFGETHLKDASITMIFKDYANVDYQNYKPSVLYLNEEYWGIHNIRDMITPHHFQNTYGVNKDEVDLLEGSELNPIADDGTPDGFNYDVIRFIKNNDLSVQNNYEVLCDRIEIESFIDYIIINSYIAKTDWPCGNAKWWKAKNSLDHEKWRWVVYDADYSFNLKNTNNVWIGDLYGEAFGYGCNGGFFIFNNLIKNTEFKDLFLNRYLFFIETVFEKNRVKNIIKTNQNRIEAEYTNHQKKWNTYSINRWNNAIEEMIEFNNKRNDKMKEVIKQLQNETN